MKVMMNWLKKHFHRPSNGVREAVTDPDLAREAAPTLAVAAAQESNPAPAPRETVKGSVLLEKVGTALASVGRQLTQQHRAIYRKQDETHRVLLQVQEGIRLLRESGVTPIAPDAAPETRGTLDPGGKKSEEPIPVQDLDLVEHMCMVINDLRHVNASLNGSSHPDAGMKSATSDARARIQGVCTDIQTTLAMRDVRLIDTMEKFDSLKHRPVGRKSRPAGAQGDGEVQRIGLVYRSNGKERVLISALVLLYEDVSV